MNQTLVLLQLAFNVLMFAALVALAWRGRPAGRAPARRSAPTPEQAKAGAASRAFAAMAATPLPPLDDLVERADRQEELAAESALRARLATFRERAS